MRLSLALDYCFTDNDDPVFRKEPRKLTDYLISQAVAAKHRDGIRDGSQRKLLARIERSLRLAIRDAKDEIDLELGQLEFIQDALAAWNGVTVIRYVDGTIQPSLNNVIFQQDLLDEIERVIKDGKEAAEAERNGAKKTEAAAR